jgi:nitrogen fixation-related uncharacterized protein
VTRSTALDALALLASVAVIVACAAFIWSILTAQRGPAVLCVP